MTTDVLTPEQRSRCMSRVRSRDTSTELELRRALWGLGLRYRLKSKLLGKPDIVFARARVAVFVDGCFWHSCPIHATQPRTREHFWREKLAQNVARDRKVEHLLAEAGWTVKRFWEHEVEQDVASVAQQIRELVDRS